MKRNSYRWTFDGLCIYGGSVVGSVSEHFDEWAAHGWANDFEDTPLGDFKTRRLAEREVERWIKDNDFEDAP